MTDITPEDLGGSSAGGFRALVLVTLGRVEANAKAAADSAARAEAATASQNNRLGKVEQDMSGLKAQVASMQAAQTKPPVWPAVVSAIAGIGALIVAFSALLIAQAGGHVG